MKNPGHILLLIAFSWITGSAQEASYPLHNGDRWEYWYLDTGGGSYDYTSGITGDTTMPDGKTYTMFSGGTSWFGMYQRQSGDTILQFDQVSGEERLLYNFSASPGDIITAYPYGGDTTVIRLLTISTDTLFGSGRRTWTFLVDHIVHAIDDEEYDTITDSLGLTGVNCFCNPWVLHGAVIGGRQYGSVAGVTNQPGQIPSAISLRQNYPNPFNPTTIIRYALPHADHVRLGVFNLLGQEIALIVDEEKTAGSYSVSWNASGVSSGVYYYRLTAGDFTETKKMVLIH